MVANNATDWKESINKLGGATAQTTSEEHSPTTSNIIK